MTQPFQRLLDDPKNKAAASKRYVVKHGNTILRVTTKVCMDLIIDALTPMADSLTRRFHGVDDRLKAIEDRLGIEKAAEPREPARKVGDVVTMSTGRYEFRGEKRWRYLGDA